MTSDKIEELIVANAQAVAKLTEVSQRTSKDVDKLITHMDEVLPFRGKVHNLERRMSEVEAKQTQSRKELDIFYTIARYPKISVLVVGCLYLLTIKEIRDPVLTLLKFM